MGSQIAKAAEVGFLVITQYQFSEIQGSRAADISVARLLARCLSGRPIDVGHGFVEHDSTYRPSHWQAVIDVFLEVGSARDTRSGGVVRRSSKRRPSFRKRRSGSDARLERRAPCCPILNKSEIVTASKPLE